MTSYKRHPPKHWHPHTSITDNRIKIYLQECVDITSSTEILQANQSRLNTHVFT